MTISLKEVQSRISFFEDHLPKNAWKREPREGPYIVTADYPGNSYRLVNSEGEE
jgi:hypothetical protein